MRRGFTTIELLIVIVIIGILATTATPFLLRTKSDSDLTIAVSTIVQILRKAQAYAQSGRTSYATPWGVVVETYGGPSKKRVVMCPTISCVGYAGTNAEITPLPDSITIPSGTNVYAFGALSGLAYFTGTTTLTNSFGRSATVTVNSQGMVKYDR